jgi:hypothetical protein
MRINLYKQGTELDNMLNYLNSASEEKRYM